MASKIGSFGFFGKCFDETANLNISPTIPSGDLKRTKVKEETVHFVCLSKETF